MAASKRKNNGSSILKALAKQYPKAAIALKYRTNIQLLAATILSAQCTDKRVNQLAKTLFLKYKTLEDFARAEIRVFEQEIRSVGFFRNKAKNIISAARIIEDEFKGRIPRDIDTLVKLPGIGRKTANIILYNAFGLNQGIAVDTHVKRLAKRLGLSGYNDPDRIEKDLMRVFPQKKWGQVNDLLIAHGRNICFARNPRCEECGIRNICWYFKGLKERSK